MKALRALVLLLLCANAHAAITVVGTGTLVQSSSSQTVTIPCPAGQANDLRVYLGQIDGGGTVPTPSGVTALKTNTSIAAWGLAVATSTDADVTVFTGTTTQQQYQCIVLRGVDLSGGVAAAVDASITGSNSSQTLLQYNAFTPGANNEILIIEGKSNNTWTSITTLSGFTHGGGGALSTTAFDWSYQIQTTATAFTQQSATITGDPASSTQSSIGFSLKAAATGGSISITSVGGTNSVTSTQTGVQIAGTGFGASQGAGSAQMLEAGGCTQALSVTGWTNTQVTVTMSQGVCLFGPATIKVTENGGTSATSTVTLNPPSGTFFANLSGGLLPISFSSIGAPTRLYGFPNDLQITSQVLWKNLTGSGACTVAANAAFTCDPTVTAFDWDFSRNGSYLGTPATWQIRGPGPVRH